MRTPGYLSVLLRHMADAGLSAGEVRVVNVHHADDCPRPEGGPCNCEPTVTSRDPKDYRPRRRGQRRAGP